MSNQTGSKFNLDDLLKARAVSVELVSKVAGHVETGMRTEDVEHILNCELKNFEINKLWHPSKIRLGTNTLKTFREPNADVTLEEGDLFFLDLGPVYLDHEGDYGETFLCGKDVKGYGQIIKDVAVIFAETKKAWQEEALTGEALYEVAQSVAARFDLELNPTMGGHRVGDFPHALHYKGQLLPYESHPQSGLWILEILVASKRHNVGAFYEDLLLR